MRPNYLIRFFLLTGVLCLPTSALKLSGAETVSAAGKAVFEAEKGWSVFFDPASTSLECRHPMLKSSLKGKLGFAVFENGKRIEWRIESARDFAPSRLALVDRDNNAQGYVSISADASRLWMTTQHRPPQDYAGELSFTPELQFGMQSFACRTRPPSNATVAPMASGLADSLLNDSLFDPERDLALRFEGGSVAISSQAGESATPNRFSMQLSSSILQSDGAAIVLDLMPDYYRSRYIPNYRPIDRTRCPGAPTGWMSWNVYFDTAGEKENLDEARIGAKYLKPFGLDIWSIESWQENSPRLPVSDFYNLTLRASQAKFPHGMKWLAEQIRALGFRPGIWTVPFGTGDESFYQAHKEWFLHAKDGRPLQNWCGRFVLDPSLPEVRKNMEETHRTMSADWGYEFFKIDGMSGRNTGYSAHFFEHPGTRSLFKQPVADPYSLCVEALRKGIGPDRIFLACQGHYSGPEVAWADAARMGSDIVSQFQPPHWENYLNQAKVTQSQLFAHNIVWYNDPDTLLVGDYSPMNMARLAATVIALPGQLTFFGDKLGGLAAERMRLLQQTLPVCSVHPLDLAPLHELKSIWNLKIKRPHASWDVVSIFNWEDKAAERRFAFQDLGLHPGKDYLLYEFWSRKFLGVVKGSHAIGLEPRSNKLLAVHELLPHPQFLSTDRHITQGGVEWTGTEWRSDSNELVCVFKLVENDPLTAAIHAPAGYILAKASAENASLVSVSKDDAPIISVVLKRESTGEGRLVLRFERGAEKK